MPGRNSEKDKRLSKYLKDNGIERTTGKCPVCYKTIPNDTFGGTGARNHYPAQCCGGGTVKND